MRILQVLLISLLTVLIACPVFSKKPKNPHVVLKTNMGNIELELYPDKAPNGVENFLNYVKSGFYNGVIFHRVIENFMIQGGGFTKDMKEKSTNAPIINEATNGLKNLRGTISYARTNVINSATSQFFINHRDNAFLDHKNTSSDGFGYAVFGKVTKGMDVVDKIAKVKVQQTRYSEAQPVQDVIIEEALLVE